MKACSRVLVFCQLVLAFHSCSLSNQDEIREMDKVFNQKDRYEDVFLGKVSVLRRIMSSEKDPVQLYRLRQSFADEFKYYSFDTTQFYLLQNLAYANDISDDYMILESKILLAHNYAEAGYYPECLEIFDSIQEENVPKELKAMYYKAYMVLSRRLRNDAPTEEIQNKKHREFNDYIQKLIPLVEENSYLWYYLKWDEASNLGNDDSRIELSLKMVDAAEKGTHDYSEACNYASISYYNAGDRSQWLKWVCESLGNDIKMASKYHLSILALCKYFYEKNDIPQAFRYTIEYGLADAVAYNGRFNIWKLSSFSEVVQQKYQEVDRLNQIFLLSLLIIAIIVITACCILLFKVSNRNRELNAVRKNLEDANVVKEEYIRSFLTIISDNIDSKRRYDNRILKMIRQGQLSALVDEVEKSVEDDNGIDTFNALFDSTFLGLYPDFVEKFNRLLKEGEAIVPKTRGALSPELRIFAMSKLGVSDSNIIASLLHYSPNTIYNYRVKIYGKAKMAKEDFIMSVGKL